MKKELIEKYGMAATKVSTDRFIKALTYDYKRGLTNETSSVPWQDALHSLNSDINIFKGNIFIDIFGTEKVNNLLDKLRSQIKPIEDKLLLAERFEQEEFNEPDSAELRDKIKRVIGIDPDVEKNGVAVYEDKKLVELHNLKFAELCEFILKNRDAVFAVENVMDNTATFKKQYATTQGAVRKVSYSVGRNAQVGYHLIDFLEHHHIPYKLLAIASNWKKQPESFKRFTGWSGRSNEETRSAAYFGFLISQ